MVHLILSGRKTQTRRRTCRYEPGKSYALQPGRGKEAKHRITILEVRQEQLGNISFRDARKEGFRTTEDFRDYWISLHKGFNAAEMVYVITFELGDTTDTPRLLGRHPGHDYVSSTAQALSASAEEVSAYQQARYVLEQDAKRSEQRQTALAAITGIETKDARERKRVRAAANQILALDNAVS